MLRQPSAPREPSVSFFSKAISVFSSLQQRKLQRIEREAWEIQGAPSKDSFNRGFTRRAKMP